MLGILLIQVEKKEVKNSRQKLGGFFAKSTVRSLNFNRPLFFHVNDKRDQCLVDWPVSFGCRLLRSHLLPLSLLSALEFLENGQPLL